MELRDRHIVLTGAGSGIGRALAARFAAEEPRGLVLCDLDALSTLPEREMRAGYAEVLKTALIAGGPLWERVARGDEVDERMILACVRTKLAIVAEDERDGGRLEQREDHYRRCAH